MPEPVRRTFPGPKDARAQLRVAFERSAYAELVAHAKESLDAEICGVLAGTVCCDDEGAFVHVEATIPGTTARRGATHVTFTQETWTAVHKTLERDYPNLRIVGWYHSHPGFGVEFSEMDLFIQRNFFSGPAQIAVLTDPLSGDTAVCVNTAEGTACLDRFWVDGRECRCGGARTRRTGEDAAAGPGDAPRPEIEERLAAIEMRLGHLVQALDEQRATAHQYIIALGMIVGVGVLALIGYGIYRAYTSPLEPPKLLTQVPVPVEIDGKPVLVGVGVTAWTVPPELNAVYLQLERERRAEEERRLKEAAAKVEAAMLEAERKAKKTREAAPGAVPTTTGQ